MKNKMMRIASILMVAVLLTVCAVSATFAKYVTSADASDFARVAKFGVELIVTGDSGFANEYATDDKATYSGTVSVKASDDANVVAPGTASTADGALKFAIKGTPEVATKIDIDFTVEKDIFVDGIIPDYTKAGNTYAEVEIKNYYPVVFTLKQTGDANGDIAQPVVIASGNLADIEDAINEYTDGATYAPNTKLDAEFELTWAWSYGTYGEADETAQPAITAYESYKGLEKAKQSDIADTFLGNVAAKASFATYTPAAAATSGDNAGTTEPAEATTAAAKTVPEDAYSTTIAYSLTITVTQID